MEDSQIGRVLRALRHRRGWRQTDLAAAASISRSLVAAFEGGDLDTRSLGSLRRAIGAVGGSLRMSVSVPGGDVQRLLDADHARMQMHWNVWLERHGWAVLPEVTFNVYGERGSIDLLAWHPATRTLLMIEIKTVAQHAALFGRFDFRGRAALRWLSAPSASVRDSPGGILALTKLPDAHSRDRRRAGRQRIRR